VERQQLLLGDRYARIGLDPAPDPMVVGRWPLFNLESKLAAPESGPIEFLGDAKIPARPFKHLKALAASPWNSPTYLPEDVCEFERPRPIQ